MKEVRSSGTKELIEEVKGLTDAMKQVGSAMASIGNSEVEFKTKGANKVIKDSEKVAEAIGKVKETADSMPKDVLSDELLGQTNAVQQRITKVKAELNKLWESVTNEDGSWSGKMLNEDQVKRYIDLYRELQKYVDIVATKKDKRFYDMINHINHLTEKPQGLKQYYDAAEEGEALRQYEKAMKAGRTEVNKQSKEEQQGSISALTAALQAMREAHEQLNSTQSETAQGIQETGQAAESAADQFMKLSDAYQQLSEIEQRIRQFGKNIEELKNAGVTDPNFRFDDEIVNEDEYKNELQQITSMLEEINKLKAQLDGMAIDPNASQAVERKGIGHANLDDLQSQLEERKRIVEQYLESDAFAESKIIEKQEELRQKITSHKDWYDYGEGTWIDEYVTKIRDEGMEIEEAYNELVNKLQENKQRVQEEQQRERDYETFDDFLREKAFGDYDTYHEYAEKYQEIANEIRNGGTTLARAMIDVGSEIDEALRQSADSSDGQDFTKPLIEQLETLEELKERAARLGSKGRIIDEDDMHDRIYSNMPGNGWDPDIYDYDGLEQYKQLLERLIELRDRALTSAREQQRAYIDWGDQSDYDEMNQFLERYNEYIAAINYMQERIEEMQNEKIQGFESSGEWDADSINWLVETLKTLAEEIRNVSQAFGRIDDESGIPTLLSQLQSLTTAITTAFNTDNIELFKQALSDVNSTLSAISSSIGPIGGGRSKESQEDMLSMRDRLRNIQYKTGATELNIDVVEGASEAEQKVKETLEKQRERYMKAYERMVEIARTIYGDTDPEGMMLAELENVPAISNRLSYAGQSANKLFGSAVITQMGDSEEAVRRLQMFVSYMKEALSYYQDLSDAFRAAQKNGETLYGIPTDPMTGFWEQVQKPLKSVSGDTKVMRQRTSKIFEENAGSKRTLQDIIAEALGIKSEGEETVLTQYQQNVEQLMETLTQFQDILSKGFGIQEKDGAITSYLSELIAKMEEVSTAAQNMTEAIQKAFNPEKDTTGLQGQIQEDINNSEVTMMEQLEQAVDLVTTAVLQKNDAFSVEATTVEQAIKRETSALDELANKIRKIAESLEKGNSFTNFLTQIAENKESLVAFAEVLKKTQEEQKNAIDSANALAQAQQQADDAVEDSSGRWARRKYWLDANGKELSKAEVSKQKYANKHVTTTYRSSRAKDEEGNLTDEWELNGIEVENNYEAAAKAAEKAEADKQKAVEKTNTFIIEQSSALERLKEKYIENSKVTIDQKDLDELATLKQQIDDALTELNSDNFTQSNATQIKQWIKDYQQKAQLAIARQQVSQELQAYSPEAARQRQETRLNDLMRQMQTSGADTTDLERRLNELMTTFRNAPELTREFFTDIRNQYNILKDEFKDTDSVFKFNQSNIDKASTALENYEKAVEAVVKAKADLDFAKNKDDPVLVQNLEKAIEKAEEAKSKFIELKQFVFDYSNAGLTTQDFKDNMVGRANDANALLSDPTQGVYYQSKNMAQQQAENTAQLERQLDIIKQLAAARSLYNKIIAEDIAGKPSATDAEREALNQLIDEVKGKAEEAAEAINKMIQSGAVKLDDTGLKQFQELLDAMRYGDKSSIKLIDDAVLQRDVQTINEAQKAIQDYAKSVEKVNELQAKLTMGEGGKGIVDQITKATKEMNDLKKSADDAMDTLDRMNKDGFSQILSSKGFEDTQKAFKEANEMRDNIVNQSGNFGLENANRAYTTLIANAERYAQIIEKRASGKALSYNEVSFLSRLEQYYQDAANSAGIFANATDEVSQKLREQFNQAMNSADVNVVSRSYEQIGETLAKIGEGSWTEEGIKKLDELRAKYDQLTQSIGQIGTATKEQREAIRQSLREMATQMQGFLGNEKSNYLKADSRDVAVVNRQMSEWMAKNTLAEQYFPQIQELQQRLNGISAGGLSEVKAEFENIKREAVEAGKVGQTFGDALKKSFGGLARYMMTYASFYRIISVIRKAINEVKELDSALMEVRKVSSETLSTLKQWQKLSFKQADEVGGSAVQIEKSTAAWLRLGKSFEEAQEAAQASVKLLNVSEFTNIDDATTSLVSMRQAFQDLTYEDFIDKLNGVGDNFSSSTDQLAQGMKNVSSVLKVAGNDIDQSLALLTAAKSLAENMETYLQNIFNCVDCLKTHTTITEKSRYDGLTTCVCNNG